MADIKDLKDTKDYLEQLKNALNELKSQNDFSLTISVNGTPIDEFLIKLEGLAPEDAINALRDGLGNIDFKTTGINESAESNEPTAESINGIEKFTSEFSRVCTSFIENLKNVLNTQATTQNQASEQVENPVGYVEDSDDSEYFKIDNNATDSDDIAPSQQLTEQTENTVVESSNDLDNLDDLDDYEEVESDDAKEASESAEKASEDAGKLTEAVGKITDNADTQPTEATVNSAKETVTGVNDLEQPVTTDSTVQQTSERVESNTENSSTSDFEGKAEDVLADTTGKLSAVAGEMADNADTKRDGIYERENFEDSVNFVIDEENLGTGIDEVDLSPSIQQQKDLGLVRDKVDLSQSLQQMKGNEDTQSSELVDSNNTLADASNNLANTVSDAAGDLKDSYDDAVSVIKDTPDEVANETYEQQDKVSQVDNTENSEYSKDANDLFNRFKGGNDTVDLPNSFNGGNDTVGLPNSFEEQTKSIDDLLSMYRDRNKSSIRNVEWTFAVEEFQNQIAEKLNNTIARGTDPNSDATTKTEAADDAKSILKDVDKFLKRTNTPENEDYETAKANAQEFISANDLDSIRKRVTDEKTDTNNFLKNTRRFVYTSDGKEPENYTTKADNDASDILQRFAKDLKLFESVLEKENVPTQSKDYVLLDEAKKSYAKLDKEANDPETGKSLKVQQNRASTVENTASETSNVVKSDSKSSDSDWLNQQTGRIQAELREAKRTVTYTDLEKLLNEIDPQVNERVESGNLIGVKLSELNSYNSAFNSAFKHIEDTKTANKTAKSKEDLENLKADVDAYDINKRFANLAEMPEKDQIGVFKEAATATKEFSDRLAELADSLPAKDINVVNKAIKSLIDQITVEKGKLESSIDTTKIDEDLNASKVNAEEANKKSALSEITDEIRNAVTGYNEIRGTKDPEYIYKYVTKALKSVNDKIDTVTNSDYAKDDETFKEKAKSSAQVFKRDFSGYQSSQAVAAIRQYVTSNKDSINQLVEALGNSEKAQALQADDYIKDIISRSDSKSDVGEAVISKQAEIKNEQLAKDIANKKAEVDTAKAKVQTAKGDNDTESSVKALEDLANKQKELADLLKAQGDTVKANELSLDSSASVNEAIDIKTDVPLELQQLNKELNAKLKEIDETIIDAKEKLAAQKKAILKYDKTIAASSGKYLQNENAKSSYDRAKATANKRVSQTQTSVYKQDLDDAKSEVINKKAIYDAVSKSDSGATTQEVQVANQEYIDSLKSLVALQEKYKDTDAVKDSDIANTNASITKASYEAERIKTGVTREATAQLELFKQELKQIQSDKTLSTADKAYYTQKVYQKAQDAYEKEKSSKDQIDVTPEGQAMPHTNEETLNAYKEFAEQAQKTTTYLHQQSVEEERLAANTVQVKQQEQLISQSSNLRDKAQRTRELADIYRRQASYAKDLTEKETLLAKASKADADAVKLEQQAYQEFLNNVKAIGKAVSDLGRSVQASINEIVSLVRAGINVTNKYINTTVNGTRKVFSSTQRVIQLFGSLSNRVRQITSTLFNFARQTVSGLQRVGASLANLTARFKTVIDRGNANPLRQSWTELNSVISLAQRAFNGVFNNELLNKAIKFDSTIASITMLLGDEATNNAQKFARALEDAFGISYSKTISDLQEITSLLQSAGLQEVGASSEQIGKAAMDFYAISQYLAALGMAGGSATEVMNKLQSGMKGMTQSIDDLGLSVRDADMNQFLKDAKKAGKIKFDVKFSELSEANKEAVRLAAILDQFRKTKNIGNFKDLLDQPYYQVSLIKSRVEEIGTMIGKIFEGIIAKFLPAVMAFLDVIQSMLGRLASGLHIDLSGDNTQKSLSDISKAANTTKDSLDGAKKSAKEFDGTAGFDEIESLNSSASNDDELDLSNLLSDVGLVSGMLEKLAKDSLKQTNKVKRNFQKMIDSIVGHHVDLTFGFNKALAKKQVKDIWGNIKRWWKAVKGTGLYVSVRIAEDLKAGRIVNDVLRIVEALTRMGAVVAEYLDPIFRDFYDKHLSKYFKKASRSIHSFSLGMKQLADVVGLIFDRKTSNSDIEKAIDSLAKKHPQLAKVAQDLYVLRDNFSGFFAIFQDNPIPDDLLKLNNLKKQFPILTQTLAILDAIVDLIRVLYKDYVTPLFDEIRSNFSLVDFLKGVETKIRDLTSLLDSMDFQITVKDNFANLLQAAKTTLENIKSVFSGTLTIGASLVKPTDSNGTVTSQANGGTSVASMAVDSYNKQSTELQGFLSSSADKASAYVTKHKDEIAGIINSILAQIEKQLELLISIIGKITQYLVEHPAFLERIASMVTSILDYVNKNANTILWLLDTIVGFTFDNFNNLLNSLQIIFDYISANKESVQEVLSMFTNFSGEALAYVAQIVTSLFDYISQHKEEVQSLMDTVLSFLGWLADHPGVLVTVFKIAVIGKVASVLKTLLSPLGSLIGLLSKLYKFGKDKGIFAGIAKGAKGLVGKAKGLFGFGKGATAAADGAETLGIATRSVPLLETTEVATTSASTATTGLAGTEALNVIDGGLTTGTALTGAAGIVAGIAGAVKDAVDGVKKFTDESSTLGDKFAAGITSAVMSDESGLTGALKNGTKWGAIGAGIGTFIAPGIGTAIGGAIGAIGGAIAGAIDTEAAINKVKEIGSGIKEVGVSIKDQFGNSMKDSINTITSDTATIPQKVGAAVNIAAQIFAGLPMKVFSIGKKLVTALCQNESIQRAFTSARNFATKLWNAAPKIFGAIGSRIASAFKPMSNAIGKIFKGIKDTATGAFNFVADKVGGFVGNVFDGASDLVDKAESALGIEPEEKKLAPKKSAKKTNSTSTTANDSRSADVSATKGSAVYKVISASSRSSADTVLADYSIGKISKEAANARLKRISTSLYIRKLGGTVPTGQMFIANEPGNPEYIGKVGTHTAVANNTMITEAMETAIYNGLVDAWNQKASSTANSSSEVNVNLSGFGLIDKQSLRRLAQMLAPYFEANTKSFRTV